MGLRGFALTCLSIPLAAPFSVPSTSSINSDISLLYYNDLDIYTASEHRSVLLLSPKSQSDSANACAQLNETLLLVNETFFLSDLVPLLQYQVYEGAYGMEQLYWVGANGSCQAVDALGVVSEAECNQSLPTLCSQSSSFGASPEPVNSLMVHAGNLSITG
ncbi:hypothetical protein BKA93DRAFT_154640 [Sparassis latifolia]